MNSDPSETIFPDHFSDHAARYEAYRPTYPDDLFAYLASLAREHDLACDCASGNGQAALGLTHYFRSVVALDASHQQLLLGAPATNGSSSCRPRRSDAFFSDGSVDLVTVATAFHWLDFPRFYGEVRRVAKPGGFLAVWGYKLPSVSQEGGYPWFIA